MPGKWEVGVRKTMPWLFQILFHAMGMKHFVPESSIAFILLIYR